MKKNLKDAGLCVTIAALFVLAVFGQRQLGLLGPETVNVAVVAAAALPPAPDTRTDGPNFPPEPVDIPALTDGPNFPPEPVDIPSLTDGPNFPPEPVDIPARS
jgi:hypothetical protein